MGKKIKRIHKSPFKARAQDSSVLNEALVLHQAGDLRGANRLYRQVLAHNPKHGDALNLTGALALQIGDLKQALNLLQKAVKYYPERTAYHVNLGSALRAQGNLTKAVETFKKALRQSPDHQEALYNLAAVLTEKGDFAPAAQYYRRLLTHRPRHVEALTGLINALRRQGDLPEALSLCGRLREISPEPLPALIQEGEILQLLGRHEESLTVYQEAIFLAPDNGIPYNNMANTLVKMGRLHQALDLYKQAVAKTPDLSEAYINLAWLYREHGMLPESWQCFLKLQQHQALTAQDHSDLLFSINYDPAFDNQEMFTQAHDWWLRHGQTSCLTPGTTVKIPACKAVRIGFISPDFFKHPVGQFILPLLRNLNPDKVTTFCYSNLQRQPDEVTLKLRQYAHHWRDITPLNDQNAAIAIGQDKIDILFDLAGHTAGNRLGVMCRKPAPIQAAWLGYVNTTGLPVIDYRLTDDICDPPGSEIFYSETLYRLPHGFFCYAPPGGAPEVTEPPVAQGGITTFSSFNNVPKITPQVVELWANILLRLPTARLLLVSRQFAEPAIADRYKELFQNHKIDAGRLTFHGSLPFREYLELFKQVDIALDPFPHSGHTITCDTLWMGVPVITMLGNRYAGRMGASIMTRIGLAELIAANKSEYVDLAVNLGQDLKRLQELRSGMRSRLLNAEICDKKQFARDFEQAITDMLRQMQPAHISPP